MASTCLDWTVCPTAPKEARDSLAVAAGPPHRVCIAAARLAVADGLVDCHPARGACHLPDSRVRPSARQAADRKARLEGWASWGGPLFCIKGHGTCPPDWLLMRPNLCAILIHFHFELSY